MLNTVIGNWIIWVPAALVLGAILALVFEKKLTRFAKKIFLLLIGEGIIIIVLTMGVIFLKTDFAGKFWLIFAFSFVLLSYVWIRIVRNLRV